MLDTNQYLKFAQLVEYFENLNSVSPIKELNPYMEPENANISPITTQPFPGEAVVTLNVANNTASVTLIGTSNETAGVYESGFFVADNRAFNFEESTPAPSTVSTPVSAAEVQQVQVQVEIQPQMSAQAQPQLQQVTPAQEAVTGIPEPVQVEAQVVTVIIAPPEQCDMPRTVSEENTIVSEMHQFVANENTNVPIISVEIANRNSEQLGNTLAATSMALNETTPMGSYEDIVNMQPLTTGPTLSLENTTSGPGNDE